MIYTVSSTRHHEYGDERFGTRNHPTTNKENIYNGLLEPQGGIGYAHWTVLLFRAGKEGLSARIVTCIFS